MIDQDPTSVCGLQSSFKLGECGKVIKCDEMRGGDVGMLEKSAKFRTEADISSRDIE